MTETSSHRQRRVWVAGENRDNGELNRDKLVATALRLIDEVGVEEMTMRGLAQVLGVSAMAAYRHVPSKQALLELAADALYEGVRIPPPTEGRWEKRLTLVVDSILDLNQRQPWALEVLLARELRHAEDMPNTTRVSREVAEILTQGGFGSRSVDLGIEFFTEAITAWSYRPDCVRPVTAAVPGID